MDDGTAGPVEHRRDFRVLLAIVALFIAVVYGQVLLAHSRGVWVAPLRDDLIFHQYARSIAEGHAYRFFPTAERTTGATSHLYVFVLAGLYEIGCRGDRLIAAAFVFNAALWIFFLQLVYAIARRLFGSVAPAAALLVAATGPVGFAFFAGHDMALATTLFFLALYGLVSGRAWLAAVALFLFSWTRPEGLLVAVALIGAAMLAPRAARKPAWIVAGAMGIAGTIGVLLLNLALTGQPAFTSMAGKGLLGRVPFHAILTELSRELAAFVRELFVGLPDPSSPRAYYYLPLIGIPLLLGFGPRLRRGAIETWLAAASLLVLALIAASGYAGVQHDKYLVWILALVAIYAVAGLQSVERILNARIPWQALYALVLAFAAVGTAWFIGDYARRVVEERAMVGAVEQAGKVLPPEARRIGVLAGSGIQYYFPDREIVNLNGITQRAFEGAWNNLAAQVEILEDRPRLRPEIWFLTPAESASLAQAGLVGPQLLSTPAFLGAGAQGSFYAARTDHLGASELPFTTAALAVARGRTLVDALDLGSPRDEAAHGYARFTRSAGTALEGNVVYVERDGRAIVDAGYAILGDEEFTIQAQPGKDVWVVMRTALRFPAYSRLGTRGRERVEVALSPPVRLDLFVNDRIVMLDPRLITPARDDLDEVAFRLPAALVTGPTLRLRMAGDHIAFHYWFYQ
jgi:uncharacterized membrane protein